MLEIIILLSFLGLIAGIIIGKLTQEEIKQGKKYFDIIQVLILVIFIVGLLMLKPNFFILVIFLLVGYLFDVLIKFDRTYLYFALYSYITYTISQNYLILGTILIFIYGLTYGTLILEKKQSMNKIILINLMLFLAVFFLLFFIKPFSFTSIDIFIGFVVGNFISILKRKLYK